MTTIAADGSTAITSETSTTEVQAIYADTSLQNEDGSFDINAANALLVSGDSTYDLNDLFVAIVEAGGGTAVVTAIEASISNPDDLNLSTSDIAEIEATAGELIDAGTTSLQAAYDNFVTFLGSADAEAAGISTDLASQVQAFLDSIDSSDSSSTDTLDIVMSNEDLQTAMHFTAETGNPGLGGLYAAMNFQSLAVVPVTDATATITTDGYDEINSLMDEIGSLDATDPTDQATIQLDNSKITMLTNTITTMATISKTIMDASNKLFEDSSDTMSSTWQAIHEMNRNLA